MFEQLTQGDDGFPIIWFHQDDNDLNHPQKWKKSKCFVAVKPDIMGMIMCIYYIDI